MSASLDEYLEANDPISEESFTAGIPENNDEEAARMLRRLKQLEEQTASNTAVAAAHRAKITDWETSVNEPLQNEAIRIRQALEGYAIRERTRDEKRKTISTPFGTVKTLPAQDKWEVTDLSSFAVWAKEHAPTLIETKTTAKLAQIKRELQAQDGQAVDPMEGIIAPGITISKPEIPYSITIKTN